MRFGINGNVRVDHVPLTLDSSVFIAALRETEEKHTACRRIVESIVHGKHVAIEPYSVLVEVVAAIRRRTGNRKLAKRIGFDLQNIDTIFFLEFIKPRALSAMEIANDIGLKGLDGVGVCAQGRILNHFAWRTIRFP